MHEIHLVLKETLLIKIFLLFADNKPRIYKRLEESTKKQNKKQNTKLNTKHKTKQKWFLNVLLKIPKQPPMSLNGLSIVLKKIILEDGFLSLGIW